MPVRMLNFLQSRPPAQVGKGNKAIQSTEEFQDMIISLGAGLKPHEYITVEFPEGHRIFKELKYPLNSLLLIAKKKIKELELPYDAYIRNEILYIVGRGVGQ